MLHTVAADTGAAVLAAMVVVTDLANADKLARDADAIAAAGAADAALLGVTAGAGKSATQAGVVDAAVGINATQVIAAGLAGGGGGLTGAAEI